MQRIYDNFARQGMMTTIGATLTQVAPGQVSITAPITAHVSQQQGFGHAALAFAIGDSAGGYSALTLMAEDQDVVTSEIKIHLLRPAIGDHLIARGRVVKPGARMFIIQSDVYAVTGADETHIALLTGTMVPVPAT